jgi:hypothetical protein
MREPLTPSRFADGEAPSCVRKSATARYCIIRSARHGLRAIGDLSLPCQPEEVVARFSIDRACVVLPSGGRGGATLRKSRRRSGSDRFRKCTARNSQPFARRAPLRARDQSRTAVLTPASTGEASGDREAFDVTAGRAASRSTLGTTRSSTDADRGCSRER